MVAAGEAMVAALAREHGWDAQMTARSRSILSTTLAELSE